MKAFAQSLLNVDNDVSTSIEERETVDWAINWLFDDFISALIDAIYDDLDSYRTAKFYTFRAILYTLNKNVARFNSQVLIKFSEIKIVYNSRNEVVNEEDSFLLSIEIINIFESASLSSHYLELKVNCVIMLLRNLKSTQNLCNETRLQVKSIESKTLDCRILKDRHNDKRYYISRISLASLDSNNLHALFRRV